MRAVTLGAVALAGLLILELILRVLGYSAPNWHRLDPQLGWTLRAHRHGMHVENGERTSVRINPAGFRDVERFLDKPDGVYRVAVLGDEHSEALDTRLQRTWWWQLGGRLEACGFQNVEILNFGVGGYSSAQELALLETAAMRYRPDLVLVQFSSADDVADNSFALARNKARPFFILDARGVARIDESFAFDPGFDRFMQTRYQLGAEIIDHSRVFQLARQLPDLTPLSRAHAQPAPIEVLTAPHEQVWKDAWRVTEAVLARMHDYSKRNGARMALAVVPHPQQRGPAYPEERLSALGRREGFTVIPLPDATHDAMAAVIARRLCASRA
jgi:hypothetical protein